MAESYKVAVFKELLLSPAETAAPVLFFRELDLPFPPTVGLSITLDDWWCGPLVRVTWNGGGFFACWVTEDDSLVKPYRSEGDLLTLEETVKWHVDTGWRRYGPGHHRPSFFGPIDSE